MPDLWMDVDVALAEVPINLLPLIDDTDFKTREESVVYNQAGLDLVWNFVTTAGAMTQTAVTPTDTAGVYDFVSQLNGLYTIEIPASGGGTINNDTEGFGWFTGFATGVLPWRGPVIGFRAAGLNNLLIDTAYSATRGLSGTALPDAVADAATGLPVSDAGGLDLDTKLANTNEVTAARMAALTDWIDAGRLDLLLDAITAAVITNAAGADIAADIIAMKVDTAAILIDTMTTLQAELDAIQAAVITNAAGADVAADIIAMKAVADAIQVVTDKMVFTVANLLDSNMLAISGDAPAADKLEEGATALVLGVCEGVPTTTNIPSDLTETTIDHYKGRAVTFTTGAVAGQVTDVTGYAADGALTVTALTNAPAAADKFVLS